MPGVDTGVGQHTDFLAFVELVVVLGPRLVCTHSTQSICQHRKRANSKRPT